ncbi:ABC transporter permease [Nocardia jinanensis]|uniref:ABC transporter permease n=1 Tax=Nocardia jinanensis TaxID=382504 RepID=A0A917RDQ0_9NOCA|nr:ABC transporter permease subunit [Nocardia jinanensis]GGL03002.1 ABC transporter permease [Nocardia jinanensis]
MTGTLARPGPGVVPAEAVLIDPTTVRRASTRKPWIPRPVQRMLGPVLLVALWQILSGTGIFDERTVPAPLSVVRAAWELVLAGSLQEHLTISLLRVGYGLVFGIALGLALAVVSGLSRIGENFVDANMEVLRAVPNFALVPLLIVWFGISEVPKILLITLAVAVSIYINTFSAIRSVDAGLVEAARSFGVGRGELIRKVILPGSLPGFLVGLRLALTASWLSLIFAETINAKKGLGRMMTDAREYFQIDVVFVLIAVYAVLGLLSIFIVRWLEARLLTWRRSYDGN